VERGRGKRDHYFLSSCSYSTSTRGVLVLLLVARTVLVACASYNCRAHSGVYNQGEMAFWITGPSRTIGSGD
jgi:hypothetical protein